MDIIKLIATIVMDVIFIYLGIYCVYLFIFSLAEKLIHIKQPPVAKSLSRFVIYICAYKEDEILLVYGIANPKPLKEYVSDNTAVYDEMSYSDHHIFSIDDLKDIHKKFEKIQSPNKLILTTEKDAVRLAKFDTELTELPLFVIPIRHDFLFGEETKFNELVINFIRNFRQTAQQ